VLNRAAPMREFDGRNPEGPKPSGQVTRCYGYDLPAKTKGHAIVRRPGLQDSLAFVGRLTKTGFLEDSF